MKKKIHQQNLNNNYNSQRNKIKTKINNYKKIKKKQIKIKKINNKNLRNNNNNNNNNHS